MTYEICAIDIETNGMFLGKNEIVSIGYVFGDKHGNINEKGRSDFKVTTPFEQRCYNEFWKNYMDIYNALQLNAQVPKVALSKFVGVLDAHEKKGEVRIVTDFAAFDPAWINYYLSVHLDRQPLYYTHDMKFRPIYDIDSYTRGVLNMNYENPWTNDNVIIEKYKLKLSNVTAHYPEDDAQHIYELHVGLINSLPRLI